ncbi:MAG: serine hydrolase domain-containing protein [Odoribacter sp.]|nr:serine hydrolase domain-containing protein [Odoribacter sp.]
MKFLFQLFGCLVLVNLSWSQRCLPVVDQQLDFLCKELSVVGLSAVVIKDSFIVGRYNYGEVIHKIQGQYVTSSMDNRRDLWKIASVTKNIIALAIMQLCDRGKCSLEDDVNKYLPYIVKNRLYPNSKITIRMLLSHYSSIARGQYEIIKPFKIPYIKDRPGEKYIYSNINYLLLGAIIESVAGERFDRYVQTNIFKPLGIKVYFNPYETLSDDLVYGKWVNRRNELELCDTYQIYKLADINNYKLKLSTQALDPAGGAIISIDDLCKYTMFIMGSSDSRQRIISESALKQMRIPRSYESFYGLGTIDYSYLIKGEKMYGHTGYAYGIYTSLIYNPDRKYGFIIFCNGVMTDYANALLTLHAPIIKVLYESYIN